MKKLYIWQNSQETKNYKFKVCNYDSNMMVTWFRIRKDFTNIVKKMGLLSIKEVYLSFLLHMNEDLDDDILLDIIELVSKE